MSTFIGQLIGFAVIVWIIVRYVVPPVRRPMTDQKETVRTQLEDSAKAANGWLRPTSTTHSGSSRAGLRPSTSSKRRGRTGAH